ncbi:general stress protein [Lentibacillus salicampi]|uniref:general stress protein n=1 Tax=Lentibacillus salicampi TaxID=175306 RepID=UPI00143058B7|nr:general stress protein [Lentibacillus salicampi]
MAEEIFGPFSSVEEAAKTVDVLELEGYFKENITIFSHGKYADELNANTDVAVTSTETPENRESSFMDKISKVIFNGVGETSNMLDQLRGKGLSAEQAAQYAKQINSGKILITADRTLKMGNDAAEDSNNTGERVNHLYQ